MSLDHLSVCPLQRSVYLCLICVLCPFVFLLLSYMSYLYILDINPISDVQFVKILSHFIGCLFNLCLFVVQQHFSLMQFLLFQLPLLMVSYTRTHWQDQSQGLFPYVSSWPFMVSGFTYFQVHFMSSVRQWFNFTPLYADILKRLSLPHCVLLARLSIVS